MEFREKQAIYLQIAEYVFEQILLKKWPVGDKILSIRDLAVAMEVNPNKVKRNYVFLDQQGIISNKRGVGFFVEPDAEDKIIAYRREQFLKNELPIFFRNLYLLKIDIAELPPQYEQFIAENFKPE
jgi:DNA-binding transcriptional regulator YhcF (GntR family)